MVFVNWDVRHSATHGFKDISNLSNKLLAYLGCEHVLQTHYVEFFECRMTQRTFSEIFFMSAMKFRMEQLKSRIIGSEKQLIADPLSYESTYIHSMNQCVDPCKNLLGHTYVGM
jgi:hypothetical protein